ncbi:Uncharacterised protein [BD1-7 clade bacterium]|uniref:FAD-binding domain-containing protein n=1 Tax=BD1-7 clade bacterium TaxID=2029982 RepID=A0A5S9QDF8_9GAMM|nr:Uncharacterised protein [BD1-7 clade bacterium]
MPDSISDTPFTQHEGQSNNSNAHDNKDLLIMGGGLAGLTLAIQVKQANADIPITVLERQRHPVDEAAHKVGESTVELATYYLSEVLGLKQHLDEAQLPKLGLRFFFRPNPETAEQDRFKNTLEIGAKTLPHSASYQLDRGILENYLAEKAQSLGVNFIDGAKVTEVSIGKRTKHHHVKYVSREGTATQATPYWLVDACSRHSPLKRLQGLKKNNNHDVNAAWFRINAKLDLNTLAGQTLANNETGPARWLSTNHLMGKGYWVWFIPLASGSTSIGIVADEQLHPFDTYNTFDAAMTWLRLHEPMIADFIRPYRGDLQDFRVLRHFSHDCEQVYSSDRWFLSGEAGAFLDPFYSPGSDLIAISNTFITAMIKADKEKDAFAQTTVVFDRFYLSMIRNTLPIYQNRYEMFNHATVMPVKIVWDFAVYWSFTAFLFIQNRMNNASELLKLLRYFEDMGRKNEQLQSLFSEWARKAPNQSTTTYIDPFDIPELDVLNKGLCQDLNADDFEQQLRKNLALLDGMHNDIIGIVQRDFPMLVSNTVDHQPGSISTLLDRIGYNAAVTT